LKPIAPTASLSPPKTHALDVLGIYEVEGPFVWSSLLRLGIRPSDLDDVFQEVFIVIHKRLHTFDASSLLTTWLFGICLRVAAAHRRRAWVRREVPTDDHADTEAAPLSEAPDELVAARQARATLQCVLDAMDLEKRAIFVMFELDDLSSEEIGAILGVPIGTVWSRLSAARKQFQAKLARHQASTQKRWAP
jgi:RNA polymerase sigma-70 factor (ECF subfamily)